MVWAASQGSLAMKTHRLATLALILPAFAASVAHAGLIQFDNSALTYRWFLGGLDQYFLDITTDIAHQPGEFEPIRARSIIQDPRPSSGNLTAGQTSLVGQGAVTFAMGADFDRGPAGILAAPAQVAPGDFIGPSFTYASSVYVGHVQPLMGFGVPESQVLTTSGFIGVRLELADGTHYGWVHIIGTLAARSWTFDADRWAYETTPDAPALVPAPATLAAGAFSLLLMNLRRRT